jgi:hypothetical protein
VHLNGEIVEGDAKRVREILAANVIDKQRGVIPPKNGCVEN